MKIHFMTLGCKVNQFETQALAQLAVQRGHTLAERDADACILNTCTVTSSGDHKNIRALHRLRRDNPNAVIALCGCFAQTEPDTAAALEGVDIVCGTADRAAVLERCEQAVANRQKIRAVSDISGVRHFESLPAGVLPEHTRALLKVEDGCNNFCTYCIIPYARGRVRSLEPEQAVSEAIRLAQTGVREIVLTGIEIASYGIDLTPKTDLVSLVDAICRAVPDVRIRLSSLEPRVITQRFCTLLSRHDNLALHFHLSLQSGCDATLQRMHRRYTTAEYVQSVRRLREAFPGCSITTDVITGFPGETEAEFQQTLDFARTCGFAAVHVFPYSERKNTPAAAMPDSVSPAVRSQRADTLRQVATELSRDFLSRFVGQTIPVVVERPHGGSQSGHSRWHFTVRFSAPVAPQGSEITARITGVSGGCLLGEPVFQPSF